LNKLPGIARIGFASDNGEIVWINKDGKNYTDGTTVEIFEEGSGGAHHPTVLIKSPKP